MNIGHIIYTNRLVDFTLEKIRVADTGLKNERSKQMDLVHD